ncbi:hypothetical protein [Curtobacterium sp. MCBA15_012]|uniref:hypothetical protein n=1 Tax=Curtobacterium sp. MCBA15_012 TaxID=1898738 RepID=UPI001587E6A8|nr:hypothetical protein [Curtobacterium sp. MCBA15_012]WIA99706.1 hypothetical protein QOL15_14525 [Curtobacterium sp. MCBA15_012]
MSGRVPGDMYGKYFPGEPYVTEFIPTEQEAAAVAASAERRDSADLLPMLLGEAVAS